MLASWMGQMGNRRYAEALYPLLKEEGYDLQIISNDSGPGHIPGISYITWDLTTHTKVHSLADVAICIQNWQQQPAKSCIKLLDAAKAGLPAICSPLISYLKFIQRHPESALIADTPDQWRKALRSLHDPAVRLEYAKRLHTAAQDFSSLNIARQWQHLILPIIDKFDMKSWGAYMNPDPNVHLRIPRDRAHYDYAKKHLKGKKILDAGAFNCWLALILAEEGFEVTALDNCGEALNAGKDYANKHYANLHIQFVLSDILDFKTGGFDTILAFEVIEHCHNPQKVREHLSGLLDPNGIVLYSIPREVDINLNHAWVPTKKKVMEVFPNKSLELIPIPGRVNVFGNWFIRDEKQSDVDAIILFADPDKYLPGCLESLKNQPINKLILVNNGERDFQYPGAIIIKPDKPTTFSRAINMGIEQSKSKYVLVLNDDVILGNNCLKAMLEAGDDNTIVNPYSNCDYNWRHKDRIEIDSKAYTDHAELSDVQGHEAAIREYGNKVYTQNRQSVDVEWVALYCTVIPRNLIEKAGMLDPMFVWGVEDVDFCQRARMVGGKCVIQNKAWCFHYGYSTRKRVEERDKKNQEYLAQKYEKPVIVFYTGSAWVNWDGETPLKEGIGGSESAVVYLSENFVKMGYKVIVFGNPLLERVVNNVNYRKWEEFAEWNKYNVPEFLVIERHPDMFDGRAIRAGKVIFDHHDMFYTWGQRFANEQRIDIHLARSPWHKLKLVEAHGLNPNKVMVIPNGINKELFK